jgi:hypothetical protein
MNIEFFFFLGYVVKNMDDRCYNKDMLSFIKNCILISNSSVNIYCNLSELKRIFLTPLIFFCPFFFFSVMDS